MKTRYISPCPECRRNNRVWLMRGMLRREYYYACYRCQRIGPTARTRRGAVRKWNRYTAECRVKSVQSIDAP